MSSVAFPDDVRPPEEAEKVEWGIGLDSRLELESTGPARHRMWTRYTDPIGDDVDDHFAALAYLSDTNAMDAVITAHPVQRGEREWDDVYMTASLDHAVWFHRPVRADEWLLFSVSGHGMANSRGLAVARVFTTDGLHVATVAQEGLGRLRHLS